MKGQYLIHEKQFLHRLFIAKDPWTVLIYNAPLLYGLYYLIEEETSFQMIHLVMALPLSFLYWSLSEYLMHRYYFHWIPDSEILRSITGSFHHYHHENPKKIQVICLGLVPIIMGLGIHFSVFCFIFRFSYLQSLYLIIGLTMVRYLQECIHYKVHRKIYTKWPMRYLQNFHLTHHLCPKNNYGQITPFWDYLLGTIAENIGANDDARLRSFVKLPKKE